jgi:hypothetical protein
MRMPGFTAEAVLEKKGLAIGRRKRPFRPASLSCQRFGRAGAISAAMNGVIASIRGMSSCSKRIQSGL